MRYSIRLLSGLFLSALLLFAGCSDNNPASPITTEPPELPPMRSMNMNLSIFNPPGSQIKSDLATNSHFRTAFRRAVFAKLIIEVQLLFPRTLLNLADEVEPELNKDGKWLWSFSEQYNEKTLDVRLVASSKDEGIYWAFYLSNSVLNLDNELLFEGMTKNNGKQGTWNYYSLFNPNHQSDEATSQLKWLIKNENSVSLTLTVLNNMDYGSKGDQIKYIKEGIIKTLYIHNANQDETIEIVWNADTKAGYIIASDYNNGEKACWNSNFENAGCPVL